MIKRRLKIVSIGNAITDVISFSDDEFLIQNSMEKNTMNLIDLKRAEEIDDLISESSTVAGGSAGWDHV